MAHPVPEPGATLDNSPENQRGKAQAGVEGTSALPGQGSFRSPPTGVAENNPNLLAVKRLRRFEEAGDAPSRLATGWSWPFHPISKKILFSGLTGTFGPCNNNTLPWDDMGAARVAGYSPRANGRIS